MSEASNERTKISASFLITYYLLNFNGTAQNVTKSNPFRQRSHGGGNCSDDGGAHEGEPALHPTRFNALRIQWKKAIPRKPLLFADFGS